SLPADDDGRAVVRHEGAADDGRAVIALDPAADDHRVVVLGEAAADDRGAVVVPAANDRTAVVGREATADDDRAVVALDAPADDHRAVVCPGGADAGAEDELAASVHGYSSFVVGSVIAAPRASRAGRYDREGGCRSSGCGNPPSWRGVGRS